MTDPMSNVRAAVNVNVKVTPTWGIHLDAVDVAKVARAVLRSTFPGVKFSVRSSHFSGGSSVHVSWTDGPTERQVDDAIRFLQGVEADIDAGEGQRYVKGAFLVNGEPYSSSCWISTSRTYSVEFTARIEQRLARKRVAGDCRGRYDRDNELYSERHRATLTPDGHLVVFGFR